METNFEVFNGFSAWKVSAIGSALSAEAVITSAGAELFLLAQLKAETRINPKINFKEKTFFNCIRLSFT